MSDSSTPEPARRLDQPQPKPSQPQPGEAAEPGRGSRVEPSTARGSEPKRIDPGGHERHGELRSRTEPLGAPPAPPPAADPTAGRPPAVVPAPPLRRIQEGSLVAGVCVGMGRSLGVDPVILRVAFALLALANGAGIVLYLILAAVMPKERAGEAGPPGDPSRLAGVRRITGWALILLGGVLLIGRFVPGVDQVVWPLGLLALGLAILVQSART